MTNHYIAKIISVEIAETPAEFMALAREMRKKVGFRGDQEYMKPVKDYFFGKRRKYSFVFMSAPRLAFNPPIKKPFLQKGRGFLNKHFFSFDEFYRAWGGEEIFRPFSMKIFNSILLCAFAFTASAQTNLPDLAKIKIAADAGDAEAQDKLAEQYYTHGDTAQAIAWYRKAAMQNFVHAQGRLGNILLMRYEN